MVIKLNKLFNIRDPSGSVIENEVKAKVEAKYKVEVKDDIAGDQHLLLYKFLCS